MATTSSTRHLHSKTTDTGISPSCLPLPVRCRTRTMPGGLPEIAEEDTHLYSDVVASRLASPRGEKTSRDPVVVPKILVTEHESSDEPGEGEVLPGSPLGNKQSIDTELHVHDEQLDIIQLAENSLTVEEKVRVQRQQDTVDAQQKSQAKKAKGKVVNPQEWGNVKFDETELDPETQEALLRTYQAQTLDHDQD